jgi:tagatose-1,6-bisphosphate aldolase
MQEITIGKLRGLQQCASSRGTIAALALDHRQNLRRSLNPQQPDAVSGEMLRDFKLALVDALGSRATAVLLDPEFSAAQAVAAGVLPGDVGLIVALEATGYTGDPTARQSRILPGWGVGKAKRMGASMVKLLVYYHPDAPTAAAIEAFVAEVAQACREQDLALMLEPLSYSLDPARPKLGPEKKRRVVVETARRLTRLGVDLLKAEFPLTPDVQDETLWARACADLSEASVTPWILLSAAVDYETYLRQVTVACRAGASGVAVGRAVWKEAVVLGGRERDRFLRTIARERLDRLHALTRALARPLTDFYQAETPLNWYRTY